MANLNDADADAFFRQGDEGTYSGGPGDSIPAGVVNVFDDLDEEALPRITREQLERRDRYKRLVTGVVGALGVSVLLAAAVRVAGTRDDDVQKIDAVAVAANVAMPPASPPEPVLAPERIAPPPAIPAPPEVPAPPVEVARAPSVAMPAEPARDTPSRTRAAKANRDTSPASHPPKATVTPAAPTTPKTMPSLVHSSPPTANFPD